MEYDDDEHREVTQDDLFDWEQADAAKEEGHAVEEKEEAAPPLQIPLAPKARAIKRERDAPAVSSSSDDEAIELLQDIQILHGSLMGLASVLVLQYSIQVFGSIVLRMSY